MMNMKIDHKSYLFIDKQIDLVNNKESQYDLGFIQTGDNAYDPTSTYKPTRCSNKLTTENRPTHFVHRLMLSDTSREL